MEKEIVVTGLGNRIEYATTDGNGLITGKREDITEQSIHAVFNHLKTEHERNNKEGKGSGRIFGEFGEYGSLMFLAPNTEIVWKKDEDNSTNVD